MTVTAVAHPNIALVKYWGKRDVALNLPAAGSLSITLDDLATTTTMELADRDHCQINGEQDPARRQFAWLDAVWPGRPPTAIRTSNNFPTAAGLASSASGFAALTVAADQLYSSQMGTREMSMAARRGSGSAARSVFGGFVLMHAGATDQACFAEPLLAARHWPLQVVIAVADAAPKAQPSSSGMELSRQTSPYYSPWVQTVDDDLAAATQAVNQRDFQKLAEISEHSCLKMHALMLSTRPGLMYWLGATVDCLHQIRALRQTGTGVFFTVDAGPQVKAVCLPEAVPQVQAALSAIAGVQSIMTVGLGPGAHPALAMQKSKP